MTLGNSRGLTKAKAKARASDPRRRRRHQDTELRDEHHRLESSMCEAPSGMQAPSWGCGLRREGRGTCVLRSWAGPTTSTAWS